MENPCNEVPSSEYIQKSHLHQDYIYFDDDWDFDFIKYNLEEDKNKIFDDL